MTCGPYYKTITMMNDAFSVASVSDATIGESLMLINYAPRVINYAARELYSIGITHGDCNMLTVQATAEVAQW